MTKVAVENKSKSKPKGKGGLPTLGKMIDELLGCTPEEFENFVDELDEKINEKIAVLGPEGLGKLQIVKKKLLTVSSEEPVSQPKSASQSRDRDAVQKLTDRIRFGDELEKQNAGTIGRMSMMIDSYR